VKYKHPNLEDLVNEHNNTIIREFHEFDIGVPMQLSYLMDCYGISEQEAVEYTIYSINEDIRDQFDDLW